MHHIGLQYINFLRNQLNIIYNTFKETVDKYLLKTNNKIFITDTSLIANKGGCDKKTYNPQLTKHHSSKISSISDIKGKREK